MFSLSFSFFELYSVSGFSHGARICFTRSQVAADLRLENSLCLIHLLFIDLLFSEGRLCLFINTV